ncbi:MAG TPA: DUF2752 domain-containing protein [Bacteroidales bacterium]|nr:DUF2752 domain-containing protein [Bacteroidales bacterium]
MREQLIQWLEAHLQPCVYKQNLGIECLGCGFQRSLIALLKGNIWESILLYPGLLPMLVLFAFLILHLIFHFKKGAAILKYIFLTDAAIIVTNYIIQTIQ